MWYDELVRQFNSTFINNNYYKLFLEGFKNTLIITLSATIIGCILGLAIAIAKVYHAQTGKLKILDHICNIYLTVIRGTPVFVQLLIMYTIVFAKYNGDPIIVAILAFGINSGAYVAEIARAGIMAVDIGQTEAGRSLGLSSTATMRHIVMPQAIKNILPALVNELIALLKETSIVGQITVIDFTRAANKVSSTTMQPYFPLIFIAIGYLMLVMIITYIQKKVERRLRKSDRSQMS